MIIFLLQYLPFFSLLSFYCPLPPSSLCYFSPESRLATLSNNLVTRNLTNSDINSRKNALQKDKENTHVINSRRYIQYLFMKVRKTYKLHPEETFIYRTNQSFKINKFVQKKKLQRTKRKITILRTEEKQLLLRLTVEIANDVESIFG